MITAGKLTVSIVMSLIIRTIQLFEHTPLFPNVIQAFKHGVGTGGVRGGQGPPQYFSLRHY